MVRPTPAGALLLLALLAAPLADAQRPGFGFAPLEGIAITGSTSTVAVGAGQSTAVSFHVAYSGNATIDVQFAAREIGGFGGPGGPRFNGTRGDGSGGPRFNGTRPSSFPTGGFPGGRGGRRMGNVTATADPDQATLAPGDEGDVTLTITVAAAAAPGSDARMAFLVRSGNRTAMTPFTVHVDASAALSTQHSAPAAGVAAIVAVLGVAAVVRRRQAY